MSQKAFRHEEGKAASERTEGKGRLASSAAEQEARAADSSGSVSGLRVAARKAEVCAGGKGGGPEVGCSQVDPDVRFPLP